MTESPKDDGLGGLSALLREHAHAAVPPEVDQAGRLALERRLKREATRGRRRPRAWLLMAAALGVALALAFVGLRPRPLSYAVRGAHGDGPYVSAPEGTPVSIAFSDGSSLEAAPGSRLRVDEARTAGARVLIERGRARVHVQHRAGSAWNFVAGPFDVRVTGTRFELGWDPSGEAVDLALEEGSVEVRGPFAETPIAVRAGQRFRADLASRSMTVIDAPAVALTLPSAVVPPAATADVAPPVPPAPPANAPSGAADPARGDALSPKPAPSSASSESWSSLVARGQFETVVAKAGERGASECESTCSVSDLRALADAARYTGRSGTAEAALMALRQRFGGTAEGRSAAFLLGRLEEARGNNAAAGRWYATYLREVPSGSLAAEALGGKMRTVFATSGRAAAEPLATEYLARYPNGVHAQTARGILAGSRK